MHELRIGGMRRLAVVAALAVVVLLALAAMPGCGSGCPTPEQRTYLKQAEEWADRTEAASRDVAEITGEVGNRPESLLDQGWQGRLKQALDDMNSANEEMMLVNAPSGTEDVHGLLVRVAETAIEANELLWQGVLDVDAETLKRAISRIEEATRLGEEVVTSVERFCE